MKTLLRSTFIADPTDNRDAHMENFRLFDGSDLGFEEPEDNAIWTFVRDFVLQHHHCPEASTIQAHFEWTQAASVVDRVASLRTLRPRAKGDFIRHLEEKAEDRRRVMVGKLLQEAGEIVSRGIEIKGEHKGDKKFLRGPIDAMRYVMEGAHAIVTPAIGSKLSGDVTADGADFLAEYDRVKSDPLAGVGQYTGLQQMDDGLQGAKRNELWIHAAFTGHMKSSLMFNWAYNQAVYFGHSSLIFSLEMPYNQVRRILYAMHSCNPRFEKIHPPLEYLKIRDGQLTPQEEWFLREHVVPDLNQNPDYGSILIEVADPEKIDFTVMDIRSRAETLYAKTPFTTLFVDHALLVAPRHWVPSTTDRLNEVIRDCKRMSMGFNKGQGIATILLFQISREGYRAALKARQGADGKAKSNNVYNLTFLSYANEAERCLILDSRVITRTGVMRVGDVHPGQDVWSSTGWRRVLNRFDNGVRRIWRLTTDRGSVLDATSNHRVRVLCDGQLGWKSLENLKSNDHVVSAFGGGQGPSDWPVLPLLDVRRYEHVVGRDGETLCAPEMLNPDLAYLLGAWDGDGAINIDGVGFTGNRSETAVQDALTTRMTRCFHRQARVDHTPARPGSFDIRLFSRPIKRWFEELAGPRGIVVPDVIRAAPKEGVVAYLRGLFDADGWVNQAGVVGINMKGACEGFLRDVQFLLTSLGIDSHLALSSPLSTQTGKRYGKVTLRVRAREGRSRFASIVGFTEPAKQALVEKFVRDGGASDRRGDVQVYPVLQTFLAVWARCPHTAASGVKPSFGPTVWKLRRSGLVPRGAVEYLVAHADAHGVTGDDVDFLRRLLDLQVMQVVSVEDTGRDEEVVDLEVEGDHEYQTGPVLSHNSADIVTASWIDEDLIKDGQVLFQCLKSRDQKPFDPFTASVFWPGRRLLTLVDPTLPDVTRAGEHIDMHAVIAG